MSNIQSVSFMRNISYHDGLLVLLPAEDGAGVEEGDDGEQGPVGDVRQEEAERLLVSTAALAAGQRGQQGPEVRRPAQDRPVDGDGDSLTAVEDQVGPPLLPHVPPHAGHHSPPPLLLASPRHHCTGNW